MLKIAKNKAEKKATLNLYGGVGEFDWRTWEWKNTDKTFLRDLKNLEEEGYETVDLYINSPGGYVHHCQSIFNQLKRSSMTVNTYVDGIAASAAFILLLAGDNVYAYRNSLGMCHNALNISYGNAKKLRNDANVLTKFDDALSTAIVDKTGMTKEEVDQKLMNYEDNWLTADEMLELGIIDKVIDADSDNAIDGVENMNALDVVALFNPKPKKSSKPSFLSGLFMNSAKSPNQPENQKSFISMELKNLLNALGLSTMEIDNEKGAYLNKEQLQALNSKLDTSNMVPKADLDAANAAKNAAESSLTQVKDSLSTALESAEVENRDKLSPVEGVNALSALVAEYGGGDGDGSTKPNPTNEDEESVIDENAPHNQLAKEFLNS